MKFEERETTYQNEGRSVSYNEQQNSLPQLKKERPWYKDLHSQVLQNVLRRLDNAFQAFFRRVKKGDEDPGYPRYKKRGQWKSVTFPQPKQDIITNIDGKYAILRVPKIGNIKLVYHRFIPSDARIKTLTIKYEGGKWYACLSFEYEFECERRQDTTHAIGIDMGLIDFVYTSDGYHIPKPKFLKQYEKRLKILQRRFHKEREENGRTKRFYKLLRALQKTHVKVHNTRVDFLHKTANDLLERADVIVYENLNIRNMTKRPKKKKGEDGQYLPNGAKKKSRLNKAIMDAGWGMFREMLKYKAEMRGKLVVGVDPKYTSQKCSRCGNVVKKSLSIRTHVCTKCGLRLNRDHNAAINILRLGLESLGMTD
jgi:putative transposase